MKTSNDRNFTPASQRLPTPTCAEELGGAYTHLAVVARQPGTRKAEHRTEGNFDHRLDNARGLRTSDARDVPYATTRRQHLSFLRQRQNSFKCILLSSPAGWWANLVASEPSGGRRRNARKGVGVPGKSYRLCLRNVLNPFDKNVVRRSTRTAKANISRKSAHTRAPSPPAAFTAGGGWGRVRAHESVGRKCPTQAGWYILL